MKVLFVQPSHLDGNGNPVKFEQLFMPFLTLATMAGLTPDGIDVEIVDDYVQDVDPDTDTDLVAITAQTPQASRAYQLAGEFRKRGTPVVMGGVHASVCPDEARQHVDSLVRGEAEDIWQHLLDDAARGQLKPEYRAEHPPDMSRLVVPRFDLFDFRKYVVPPFARTPLLPIQTSRGCPNTCEFCMVPGLLGNRMRYKPVEHVVEEIEATAPSRVMFVDDNLTAEPKRAKELFAALKPLRLRWACQMSTQVAKHPELLDLAAEAGCHETFIGIETLSSDTLGSVRKGFNRPAHYADLLQRMSDVGILPQVSFVYGFDGDTKDDLRRTVDTVLEWAANYMYIFVLTPYPGTPLFDKINGNGRLTCRDWSRFDGAHPVMQFATMSQDELLDVMWESYRKFYSLPGILRRLWRFKWQYIKFFPRDFAIEEVFFSLCMRKAVLKGNHPFSLGQQTSSA